MNVTALEPATAGSAETVAIEGLLEVIVTATALEGVSPSVAWLYASKSLPIVISVLVARPGRPTEAVMLENVVGALNPAGTPTTRFVLPSLTAWKVAVPTVWFPVKLTGEVIVPIDGVPLVIDTWALNPPRRACRATKFKLLASSTAGAIETVVSAPVVVRKLEVSITNPEGLTVT